MFPASDFEFKVFALECPYRIKTGSTCEVLPPSIFINDVINIHKGLPTFVCVYQTHIYLKLDSPILINLLLL